MALFFDPASETALLALPNRSLGQMPRRLGRSHLLDQLDVSAYEFLGLVAALEDQCGAVLPDSDLARCETLGDLMDRLRRAAPSAALTLDDRADQPADTRRHDHGEGSPEGDPRRRAPRRRAASFGAGHAEQHQAS